MTPSPTEPDNAVETQAAWSTLRADRRFLWLWLVTATTLSVAGNIGHAWLTSAAGASRWMAVGWAAAPPGLLMLAIHGLPTLARMLGSAERDTTLTAVVWGVTAGAFGWSAFGIFGFTCATGIPARMAWLAPLVIDLSVFGATRGLVLTAPLAARMKASVVSPHSGVEPLPNVDASPPATDSEAAQSAPAERDAGAANAPKAHTPSTPLGVSAQTRTVTPQRSSTTPDTVALAKDIVDSGAVRKPVDTVAAVLAAAIDERRKAVIAEQTGVHHSVVTRILDAAESRRRHELVPAG